MQFSCQSAFSFENKFAVSSNIAQIFIGGFNISAEYNPNNLPLLFEVFSSSSRERPGDDLISQKYMGIKISYNMTGLSGFDDGILIRSGVENVDLDYYWDDKSNCVFGCPGDNYKSKKGSTQFTRYNLGIGIQSKTPSNLNLFGRENFILFRAAIEKKWSDQNQIDAIDRSGNPLQEKLAQFNNYSLFFNVGLIF
jgi:hypothetical protein